MSETIDNPFRGLAPYEESDYGKLFGRDKDLVLIKDRIYSARTTLLFAASGVGKTSFLRAGLIPDLKKEYTICYHRDWTTDPNPWQAVANSIVKSLAEVPGFCQSHNATTLQALLDPFRKRKVEAEKQGAQSTAPPLPPDEANQEEVARLSSPQAPLSFLLILDQFEEVFRSLPYLSEFGRFIDELCYVISSEDLRVRVIFSMRDDFLGELSIFDNRILDVFNNYYRLTYPTCGQAAEIIQRTSATQHIPVHLRRLDKLVQDLATFDPGLAGLASLAHPEPGWAAVPPGPVRKAAHWLLRVMKETLAGLFRLGNSQLHSQSAVDLGVPKFAKRNLVITPYLQIVCRWLWDSESAAGDFVFLSGYGARDAVRQPLAVAPSGQSVSTRQMDQAGNQSPRSNGGANRPESTVALSVWNPARLILRQSCREKLNKLDKSKRDLAARAFDFLMTRRGARMAYELDRLAEHMEVKRKVIEDALDPLAAEDTRILRLFQRPPDQSWWVELYHDMYAPIVYEWKQEYQAQRSKEKRRTTRIAAICICGMLVTLALWSLVHPYVDSIREAREDYPVDAYRILKSLPIPFLNHYADGLWAAYWDRRALRAELRGNRDDALLLTVQALLIRPTDRRRREARALAGNDYSNHLLHTFRAYSPIATVAYYQDDKILIISDDSDARLVTINPASPDRRLTEIQITVPHPSGDRICQARFSPDGKQFFTRACKGEFRLWSSVSGQAVAPPLLDVTAANYSANPAHLLLGYKNGTVELRRYDSLTPVKLRGDKVRNPQTIKAVAFSSDGKNLLVVRADLPSAFAFGLDEGARGTVSILDAHTLRTRPFPKIPQAQNVFLSPDGRTVLTLNLTLNQSSIQLWNISTGKQIGNSIEVLREDMWEQPWGPPVRVLVDFSPEGNAVLLRTQLTQVRAFSLHTGLPLGPAIETALPQSQPHFDLLRARNEIDSASEGESNVRLSPDGKFLLIAQQDGGISFYRSDTGELVGPILRQPGVSRAVFSQSGKLVMAVSNGVARLWQLDSSLVPSTEAIPMRPRVLALSQQGNVLAGEVADKVIRVINTSSGAQIATITADSAFSSITLSPPGDRLAAGLRDGSCGLWLTHSGDRIGGALRLTDAASIMGMQNVKFAAPPEVIFSPDGKLLITRWHSLFASLIGSQTGAPASRVRLWRAETGELVGESMTDESTPTDRIFSPDSKILAIAEGSALTFYRTDPWMHLDVPQAIVSGGPSFAFDAEGHRLAFEETLGRVVLIEDALNQGPRGNSSGFEHGNKLTALAFSPDRKHLATLGVDNKLHIWNIATGKRIVTIEDPDGFTEIKFNSTGTLLLTINKSGYAHLWLTKNGSSIGDPIRYPSRVTSAAFAADGKSLICWTDDWVFRTRIGHGDSQLVSGRNLRGNLVIVPFTDGSSLNMRAVVSVGPGFIEVDSPRFDLSSDPIMQGDSAKLIEQWGDKLGLRINDQGEPVLLQPSAVSSPSQGLDRMKQQ